MCLTDQKEVVIIAILMQVAPHSMFQRHYVVLIALYLASDELSPGTI